MNFNNDIRYYNVCEISVQEISDILKTANVKIEISGYYLYVKKLVNDGFCALKNCILLFDTYIPL